MIQIESLLFTKIKKRLNEEKDYSDLEDTDAIYGNYYFEYALQYHRYDGDRE